MTDFNIRLDDAQQYIDASNGLTIEEIQQGLITQFNLTFNEGQEDFDTEFTDLTQDFVTVMDALTHDFDAEIEEQFAINVIPTLHESLLGRDADGQHPINAITGLNDFLDATPNSRITNSEMEELLT